MIHLVKWPTNITFKATIFSKYSVLFKIEWRILPTVVLGMLMNGNTTFEKLVDHNASKFMSWCHGATRRSTDVFRKKDKPTTGLIFLTPGTIVYIFS